MNIVAITLNYLRDISGGLYERNMELLGLPIVFICGWQLVGLRGALENRNFV